MFSTSNRALGSMFGAAYGDSLGASVEFKPRTQIRKEFGQEGIAEPASFLGLPAGAITDDTQQAIAIGNALINACLDGMTDQAIIEAAWKRLKEWYATQADLGQRRAPGETSLAALSGAEPGTLERRINASDSCGAVMRVHPVGIVYAGDPEKAFRAGMLTAALTHGGDEALLSAGAMAAIVSALCDGVELGDALHTALALIGRHGPESETLGNFRLALALPVTGNIADHLATLGLGWNAQEALAIAVYAARCHPGDLQAAVRLAVNHDGDSDSTGSLAGAIVGAMLGIQAVPRDWCGRLERRTELSRIATCLSELTVP